MRAWLVPGERRVIWVASSKRDLTDVELIRDRLNAAREDYQQRYGKGAT